MKNLSSKLQDLGKALMMPISVIAAAGIFLGLAAALQNPNITGQSFNQLEFVQLFLGFIRKVSGSLFGNFPLFFAVAGCIGDNYQAVYRCGIDAVFTCLPRAMPLADALQEAKVNLSNVAENIARLWQVSHS